jgi:hypothetical protein
MHIPGRMEKQTTTVEWLMTHNIVPLFFTTILAIIGIVGYFANIGTKVEVVAARQDDYSKQQQQFKDLLNAEIDAKLKSVGSQCTVLGIQATPTKKR